MKTFPCLCGNTLFFGSVKCVQCNRDTGMCPVCDQVVAIVDDRCTNADCGTTLRICSHRQPHYFCNRMVDTSATPDAVQCDYCALTSVTPDLTDEDHRDKWRKLERAKQRVLYIYEQAGFEIDTPDDPNDPALSFVFKADGEKPVHTGHASGVITVNIREADSVERERRESTLGSRNERWSVTFVTNWATTFGSVTCWGIARKPAGRSSATSVIRCIRTR